MGTGGAERRAGGRGGGVGERRSPLASGFEGARGRKDSKGVGGLGMGLRAGVEGTIGGWEGRASLISSMGVARARL